MPFALRAPAARVQGRRVVQHARINRPTNVTSFQKPAFGAAQQARRGSKVVCMAKKSVGDLTKDDLEVRTPSKHHQNANMFFLQRYVTAVVLRLLRVAAGSRGSRHLECPCRRDAGAPRPRQRRPQTRCQREHNVVGIALGHQRVGLGANGG